VAIRAAAEPCRRRRRLLLAIPSHARTHSQHNRDHSPLAHSHECRFPLTPSRTTADSHCGRLPLWSRADARGSRGRKCLRVNDGCRRGSAARSLATGRPRGADCCARPGVPADAPSDAPRWYRPYVCPAAHVRRSDLCACARLRVDSKLCVFAPCAMLLARACVRSCVCVRACMRATACVRASVCARGCVLALPWHGGDQP
jgi:hypothetical protein